MGGNAVTRFYLPLHAEPTSAPPEASIFARRRLGRNHSKGVMSRSAAPSNRREFVLAVVGGSIRHVGPPERSRRAGDVLPGDFPVDRRFLGEAEDAFAEDVAHDLGGAALDGVGPAAEEAADGGGRALVGGGPRHGPGAEDVDGEVLEALVVLGL